MKTQSSTFTHFTLKAILLIICTTSGLMSFTTSDAQSIVGKWSRTGTTYFVTDKATGKQTPVSAQIQQQMDQAMAARGYTEVLELKANSTYTSTVSAKDKKAMVHTENYSLSGNKLELNIPLVNKEKTTITIKSIDGTTMVWDMVFMGKLTEIIYTRI